MNATRTGALARLLQLASPALPVGAYSYSQGLEAAIESRIVHDAPSAQRWISEMLDLVIAPMEAPTVAMLHDAWQRDDFTRVDALNALFLASRETAELRAETVQMGYSLTCLLSQIGPIADSGGDNAPDSAANTVAGAHELAAMSEPAFPTAFAFAAHRWEIDRNDALIGYLWSWLENQTMAAIKAIPLGQTDGQRILLELGARIEAIAARAATTTEDELENYAPQLAILSSHHATQYSRLFRS